MLHYTFIFQTYILLTIYPTPTITLYGILDYHCFATQYIMTDLNIQYGIT